MNIIASENNHRMIVRDKLSKFKISALIYVKVKNQFTEKKQVHNRDQIDIVFSCDVGWHKEKCWQRSDCVRLIEVELRGTCSGPVQDGELVGRSRLRIVQDNEKSADEWWRLDQSTIR